MEEPRFYTVQEFAKILKINDITVKNAIIKGYINAFKPIPGAHSSRWRIPATELDRLQTMSEEDRMKAAKEIKGKGGIT